MRHTSHFPRPAQRGEGWVGTLIWGLIGAAIIFVAYQLVKPQYKKYYLEQKVEQVVHFSGAPDAGKLQNEILDYAEREHIELAPEQVVVTKKPNGGAVIVIEYDSVVNLIVTKYTIHTRIENDSNQY
jgi:hypothetical protein